MTTATATAIWLGVLAILVVLFVVVARRVGSLVARTHELEDFQRSVAELEAAFAAAVDPLLGSLEDLVRGRIGDAAEVAAALPHVAASLRDTGERARRVVAPAGLTGEMSGIVRELGRAVRAAEHAERGLEGLLEGRHDRQGETTVDLKRGSLNLRHARDMVRTIATQVAALTPAEFASRRDSPWVRGQATPVVYIADGTDDDVDPGD